MGNFQKGNKNGGFGGGRNGGKPSFQNKPWEKDRPATMHSALCGECGRKCEVPFRPTGEKPVYCNDCFSGMRNGEERQGNHGRRDFGGRPLHKEWNDRPTPRADFSRPTASVDESTQKQLRDIASKLDRLVVAFEAMVTTKTVTATPVKEVTQKPGQTTVVKKEVPAQTKKTAKVQAKKAPATTKKITAKTPAPKTLTQKAPVKKTTTKKK